MISTSDFRNGTMFEMDGQLLQVVTVEHIKLARAGAVIKARLRNVLTGSIFDHSFPQRGQVQDGPDRQERGDLSLLRRHTPPFHGHADLRPSCGRRGAAGVGLPLLKEGSVAYLLRFQDRLIGVELPINVELKVVSTDPGFKGDTVSGSPSRRSSRPGPRSRSHSSSSPGT